MSKYNSHSFAVGVLRRGSYRWAPRHYARQAAKVGRNQYRCAKCAGIFGRKDTAVDHIEPVVNPFTGFTSFDDFIKRLYCEQEGFQLLCKPHHNEKSALENTIRKATKVRLNPPTSKKRKKTKNV